jgi:hypothetical protein
MKERYSITGESAMEMEILCVNVEYMELDEEERLTERDALMLGVVRELDEERSDLGFAA